MIYWNIRISEFSINVRMSISRAKAFFLQKRLSRSFEENAVIKSKLSLKQCTEDTVLVKTRPSMKQWRVKSISFDVGEKPANPWTR